MDIDVKNALNRVLSICDSIGGKDGEKFKADIIEDIYCFISEISKSDSIERCEYFNIVYLNGNYSAKECCTRFSSNFPKSLHTFFDLDDKLEKRNINTSEILLMLFVVLGRSYSSSKFDRKDIDKERMTTIIKELSDKISNRTKEEAKPKVSQKSINTQCVIQKEIVNSTEDKISLDLKNSNSKPEESLEDLLQMLDSLIGLNEVKKEVKQIINLVRVQKKGAEFGEKNMPLSLHLVFWGNPGTGKTTVARLLSKIYKCLGILSQGQLIEVDRGGLVAGYVGQTATKTQEVIDKAMGGILFIDEAYTLIHGKGENDFGQEAVDTLLKAMEDHREDFIVIVAGYPELMKEFISSNPGLRSRFNKFINFEDYKPQELLEIFKLQCKNQNLTLDDQGIEFLSQYFILMYENRTENYANGRDVRNYFENVVQARANRLSSCLETISHEEYLKIEVSDLREASKGQKIF